jgi:hypothetical protein
MSIVDSKQSKSFNDSIDWPSLPNQ